MEYGRTPMTALKFDKKLLAGQMDILIRKAAKRE